MLTFFRLILILILSVLLVGCHKGEEETETKSDIHIKIPFPKVHISFDYDPSITSHEALNTESERADYKAKALSEVEKLFDELRDRFGFAPDHQIHIKLVDAVQGMKNVANTVVMYNPMTGGIARLTMHFPYEMFERVSVRAHELTHAFIAPFHLPTWADEGFAVYIENMYADTPQHPVFETLQTEIRRDTDGVNAVQHWTEGSGIYADVDLTLWCYRYSHTLIHEIEKQWPGTFAKVFQTVHPQTTLSTPTFVVVLDGIISDTDMVSFFEKLGFVDLR